MPNNNTWLLYVLMAGLCWGTYVPLIAYGGKTLNVGGPNSVAGRYAALLMVGVAYFVIAVVFPLLRSTASTDPTLGSGRAVGLTFAGLAGVAGALGRWASSSPRPTRRRKTACSSPRSSSRSPRSSTPW